MNKIAILYDFDDTLVESSIKSLLIDQFKDTSTSWRDLQNIRQKNDMDNTLGLMYYLLHLYNQKNITTSFQDLLIECGQNVKYFEGVESWFDLINTCGKEAGIEVEHYLVTSNIYDLVNASSISPKFKFIYASKYLYNDKKYPIWPSVGLNYTVKTQCMFRVYKGILNMHDDTVNDSKPKRIPFANMIFIGDGSTDVPVMSALRNRGGNSIAVYSNPKNESTCHDLMSRKIVNNIAKADFNKGSELFHRVKSIIIDGCYS